MSRIAVVAFDVVGTLLTLRESVGETYARIATRFGVSLPAWRLDDGFRRILRSAPPMCFPGVVGEALHARERAWWAARVRETFKATDQTVRFDDFDAFFAELFSHYATRDAWQPAAGAHAELAALRAGGRRLAVASNFDHRLEPILQAHDLAGFFETLWTPARAGAAKPDGRFFAGLLTELGVPADAVVHVGDDAEHDAAAARAAGLHVIPVEAPATLHGLQSRIAALEGGGN